MDLRTANKTSETTTLIAFLNSRSTTTVNCLLENEVIGFKLKESWKEIERATT